ncbi:hypothetical protein [Acinetobacter stercoris]|uniref:Uncharacterized protein n=1 Tax=Acinetobacter stercoris TaxID=2126983 RepID=A0A2U3MV62_9GAMM|nr:hypothetical protein [Acinetobacter stercoris]SPL69284.1 hypothetical protein KPC_0462 [Acinetobacter stercoris]
MLKTYVEFRSNLFPKQPNESIDSDGEIWGVKLAEFLCQQFNAKGIACLGFCEEDRGYRIFLTLHFTQKSGWGVGIMNMKMVF